MARSCSAEHHDEGLLRTRRLRGAFAGAGSTPATSLQYDGYIKNQGCSKDIIISRGENISSIEVEDVLYRHPDVLAPPWVAKADERWGETPCAFVELKTGRHGHARRHRCALQKAPGRLQGPQGRGVRELPKTSTGKIPEIRAAQARRLRRGDRRLR